MDVISRVLVDGGVLDNLPVDRMAARDDGPIIAVDVSQRFDPALEDAGITDTDAGARRAKPCSSGRCPRPPPPWRRTGPGRCPS